jgi:hypothetical protein
MVNRTARVGGLAYGGQILLSEAAWNEVSKDPANISSKLENPQVTVLGRFALKVLHIYIYNYTY